MARRTPGLRHVGLGAFRLPGEKRRIRAAERMAADVLTIDVPFDQIPAREARALKAAWLDSIKDGTSADLARAGRWELRATALQGRIDRATAVLADAGGEYRVASAIAILRGER